MIITRTPYRISLFGGSTDYEQYYSKYESFLIGFCIDKYSYLSGRFTPNILPYHSRFSYSQSEIIEEYDDSYFKKIKHNGIRGALEYMKILRGLEVSHFCDIPSQTGLGSSSSFIVGLVKLIHSLYEVEISKFSLAKEAIEIERNFLKESGGIQDQIWAAYGGFNSIHIDTTGDFNVKPLPIGYNFKQEFLARSFLLYTGNQRNSFELATHSSDSDKYKQKIQEYALQAYSYFQDEDLNNIGVLLNKSWEEKKKIKNNISNPDIDKLYNELLDVGMIGGKLIGSGGSGFIFGILKEDTLLPKDFELDRVYFNFDDNGSKVIYK